MNVWLIHIKAGSETSADPRPSCIKRGIVGTDWYNRPPDFIKDRVLLKKYSEIEHKNDHDRSTELVKLDMQINDLVWARGSTGDYFLGRVTSDYYQEEGVRKCEWYNVGMEDAMPKEFTMFFIMPVSAYSVNTDVLKNDSMNSNDIKRFSKITYNLKSNCNMYNPDELSDENVMDLEEWIKTCKKLTKGV